MPDFTKGTVLNTIDTSGTKGQTVDTPDQPGQPVVGEHAPETTPRVTPETVTTAGSDAAKNRR